MSGDIFLTMSRAAAHRNVGWTLVMQAVAIALVGLLLHLVDAVQQLGSRRLQRHGMERQRLWRRAEEVTTQN
jgi:hypothetical protein